MYRRIPALSVAVVLVDQWIKGIVLKYFSLGGTKPLIENVFHITYVRNYGAAFNLLEERQGFLLALTAFLLFGLLCFVVVNAKKLDRVSCTCLLMIIGGGLGNLIDRFRFGYVVDYLDARWISFPVFNFADCCIVVGAALLFLFTVFFSEKKESPEDSAAPGKESAGPEIITAFGGDKADQEGLEVLDGKSAESEGLAVPGGEIISTEIAKREKE